MYLSFFGLAEKPFAITPDPRYLYLSGRHADALAHLVYGISHAGGFIQLTGEVGTGKTTTIRSLLARAPKNAEIALIINPRLSPAEFVQTLCEELGLGLSNADNIKEMIDQLNRYLLRAHAEGRRVVLIVDEAQNLSPEVLEQVRLLTNLETASQKLLQIILIGQPELRELLARNDLRQLAQRVTARYHLDPLSAEETAGYVRHRLRVAGTISEIFTRAALREVYRLSGGVPRVINILCDRALLGAYTEESHEISAGLVRRAGSEVFDEPLAPRWLVPAATVTALALLAIGGWALWHYGPWFKADIAPVAAAPEVVTPPAPPPAPTLSQLLPQPGLTSSADAAFTQLLELWQAGYVVGGTDGCTQATQQGLECVNLRSTLAQLRELNRPAILMLSDDAGRSYQAVLAAMGEDSATLRFGTQQVDVGIADLSRYWFGELVLLWKPAVPTVTELRPGTRGPAVRHLRSQLLRWRGEAIGPAVSAVYDAELGQRVEEFQRSTHLMPDGIAHIETQLLLDAALAAPGTPLLRAAPPAVTTATTPVAGKG